MSAGPTPRMIEAVSIAMYGRKWRAIWSGKTALWTHLNSTSSRFDGVPCRYASPTNVRHDFRISPTYVREVIWTRTQELALETIRLQRGLDIRSPHMIWDERIDAMLELAARAEQRDLGLGRRARKVD